MKARVLSVAVVFGLLLSVFASVAPPHWNKVSGASAESWAIIVGVEQYQYATGLQYAADDACDLYALLSPVWGADHLKLLTNSQATRAAIRSAILDWLDPLEDADDTVLFYFCGHGDYWADRSPYDETDGWDETIVPYDGFVSSDTNQIYDDDLDLWFDNLEASRQAVIVDSCWSGGMIAKGSADNSLPQKCDPDDGLAKDVSQTGRVILTSSTEDELSWESPHLMHGVFSHYFLDAFDWLEVVDSNSDHQISAEELFYYAQPRTLDFTANIQNPQLYDGYAGPLVLLKTTTLVFDTNPELASLTVDGKAFSPLDLPLSKEFISGTTHVFSAPSESGTLEAVTVQSPHPYPTYYDNTWIVDRPGALRMRIHFKYIDTEADYDYVYVKDAAGSVEATYSGLHDHFWTPWISDGTIKIELHSDYSVCYDGFLVDAIEWQSEGTRYSFTGWSDGLTTPSRTTTIFGSSTYTANYVLQNYLTVDSTWGDPEGDGWYDEGSVAEFSVLPIVDHGDGTGHAFTAWGGASTENSSCSSVVMDSPKSVAASWKLQYELTIESECGGTQGEGWYDLGSTAQFSVPTIVDDGGGTRYLFLSWTGASTANTSSCSLLMDSPKAVAADWKTEHSFTVQSEYGTTQGAGWYEEGKTATFAALPPIDPGAGTRYLFTGWGGASTATSSSASIIINEPKVVTGNWRLQYRLSLTVNPSGMTTIRGDGWYDAGDTVTTGTADRTIADGDDTISHFSGWVVDGTQVDGNRVSLLMDSPHIVSAEYAVEYLLLVNSDHGDPVGTGWHEGGSSASISVTSPVGTVIRKVFTGWSGDLTSDSPSASIVMDGPKSVTAEWRTDYSQLYMILGGVVGLAAVAAVAALILRRRARQRYTV